MKRLTFLTTRALFAVIFAMAFFSGSADAEIITVRVEGTVSTADTFLDINIGDTMVGYCVYDTSADDLEPSTYKGTYAVNSLTMDIGDYSFANGAADPGLFEVWRTDLTYLASAEGGAVRNGSTTIHNDVDIKLIDLCNASSSGPNDSLPLSFPEVSFFNWRNEFSVSFFANDNNSVSALHLKKWKK